MSPLFNDRNAVAKPTSKLGFTEAKIVTRRLLTFTKVMNNLNMEIVIQPDCFPFCRLTGFVIDGRRLVAKW